MFSESNLLINFNWLCLNGTNLNQKNDSYSVFDSLANEDKIVNVDSN
jgi:hypothetical protein